MKINLLIIACILFCLQSFAQSNRFKFYIYTSEADFFDGKKSYRGEFIVMDGWKIKYITADGKKHKYNIKDSARFHFGYEYGNSRMIRISSDPKVYTHYVFGGGTKDAFALVIADRGYYDKSGYLFAYDYAYGDGIGGVIFVDRVNHLDGVGTEAFLKSKPELLEKYLAEKKATSKALWYRNEVATDIKYLKLFNGVKD